MGKVRTYKGLAVKDGRPVEGYAAIGGESERAFILVPSEEGADMFHIVEVDIETLE